ncbi:hypothetical protein M3G18_07725 [Corynebacterium sp. p3-SID1145]|uniref:hypothetical protein n=1 Tax=unclassified Corynebacterium TaxID=2624378 RepID=UPI0021AAD1D8|nr:MULTISPECIES: hypothetical protein [unclassified Corynebacterium]MCT1452788.1 hypothetical protein [Corynebacterium sp. p3-SID1145]MCT1461704.1 hypothetical protein [Corynebacterium sp. p3-SID1140]
MKIRRRAACFTSILTGTSLLLAACGGTEPTETPQAQPEEAAGGVEIVTVTQYNDGTVLGPDDEIEGEDPAQEPEAEADANTEADAEEEQNASSDLAPGEFEFIGTVEKQTTEEVLNGKPNPNPGTAKPSDRYFVLVLDEPTEFTANKAGDQNYSRVNELVELGTNSKFSDASPRWDPYVGKRIRLIVTKRDMSYRSDTGLPLGALMLTQDQGRIEEL